MMKLIRYWFVTSPENRFGPGNFGVTAYSKEEGIEMIIKAMTSLGLQQLLTNLNEDTEVIANIDIRILDEGHIIPNMGVVTYEGVWYPNLNM